VVKVRIACGALTVGLVVCWSLGDVGQVVADGFLPNPSPQKAPSMMESISSGFQRGLDSVGSLVTPKPPTQPPRDPTSLNTQAKPSPELYVAIGRLHHQKGRLSEAGTHYQRALNISSNHLGATLGLARVKDDLGHHESALQLYQAAAKAYPKKASVFNNLGLSYARCGMRDEALGAMTRAVQLEPRNVKYRNNIAATLVDAGRNRDSYMQLRAVFDHPTSLYNLGYMLKQRGQVEAGSRHFAAALKSNPSFAAARRELDQLSAAGNRVQTRHPPAGGAMAVAEANPVRSQHRLPENPTPKWPQNIPANPQFEPPRQQVRNPRPEAPTGVAPSRGPWSRQPLPAYGNRQEAAPQMIAPQPKPQPRAETVPVRDHRPREAVTPFPQAVAPVPPSPPKLRRLPPVQTPGGATRHVAPMPGDNLLPPTASAPLPAPRAVARPY
jgi:tetratricopeptide (TPR) repeat protein